MSTAAYTHPSKHIYATQFRNLSNVELARRIANELLAVDHFHYICELSDIWVLIGSMPDAQVSDSVLLAWAWITPWKKAPEGVQAIRMIDVPEHQRGQNFAMILIAKVEEELACELRPEGVVRGARDFWLKNGYEEDSWL